jgi:hypothetical protein
MHWVNEHLGPLAALACSLTALVLVYSWGDGISPLAVIKKAPSALRLVFGTFLALGIANLVLLAPGIATALVAEHWLGDWGLLFVWPGLFVGYRLLVFIQKPLLAVYGFIAGVED